MTVLKKILNLCTNYATSIIFLNETSVFMLADNIFIVLIDFELHTHGTRF